jgi:probable phosphoglycerate mutase
MKILIVRHADPRYVNDSLTEKGWREAEYLSERLKDIPAVAYYVSPLGRAKDTANVTLRKIGKTAVECDWLREFEAPIYRPDRPERKGSTWDWWPSAWTAWEPFFSKDAWYNHPIMEEGGVRAEYLRVVQALDRLLAQHGYERSGYCYKAVRPNNDTIVFFCHFDLECVLLSHLLNVSPMVLWHGTCAAPTSVTILNTEERLEGTAYFRMSTFGDTSHLYAADLEPSFHARFCEVFTDQSQRH